MSLTVRDYSAAQYARRFPVAVLCKALSDELADADVDDNGVASYTHKEVHAILEEYGISANELIGALDVAGRL